MRSTQLSGLTALPLLFVLAASAACWGALGAFILGVAQAWTAGWIKL